MLPQGVFANGEPEARPAADASDGDRGARAAAEETSKPAHGHEKIYPYLLRNPDVSERRANHVWAADITYIPIGRMLSLSRGDHRLGIARSAWVAAVGAMDVSFCLAALEEALAKFRQSRRFSTPTKARSSLRPAFTGALADAGHPRSPWTAEAAGWTTCSSSSSGGRSNTRTSISRATPMAAKPRAASLSGSLSAMIDARAGHWQTVCQWRSGARRRQRQGCGHDGQRLRVAHRPGLLSLAASCCVMRKDLERSRFQPRTCSDGPDARVSSGARLLVFRTAQATTTTSSM